MPESELLQWLVSTLVRYGPAVLFLTCLLETAIFAGLILPVGALIAFSAMLSSRGVFEPEVIVAVASSGALVGDQLGFAVGRWFRGPSRPTRGDPARVWSMALARTELLVRSRGALGISAARGIPFVRTVMPWFAGRSGITWGRFVLFDVIGVGIWGVIYIGGGFLAGEGWRQLVGEFGELAGTAAVAGLLLAVAVALRGTIGPRIRRRAPPADGAGKRGAT